MKYRPFLSARPGDAFALAGMLALAVSLGAQTPPAAPPASAEEPVSLSPFIIATERDTGWSANDTLSATRTKQALRDVPVAIDAVTEDFIQDLNLFTGDEVAKFVANVYAADHFNNDNDENNFSFRGLSQRFNISRNYFRWYIPTDNYNVERIDFGKGSNSLIFGDVEPGGQGAVFTKRARLKNFGSVLVQGGSEGAYRAQIDVNRRVTRNLALRLNAVRRSDRTFQDFTEYGFAGEHLTLTWQPFKHTTIRIEAEQGKYDNARGYAGLYVREIGGRGKAYQGSTTTGNWYVTSDGLVVDQRTVPAIDRGTNNSANGAGGGQFSLLEGGYVDVQLRNAAGAVVGVKRINGFPRHYNLRGTFDNFARPFGTYSVYVEQRIGPVDVELAYNHQNQEGNRNDNFFGSIINVDGAGRAYLDASGKDLKRFGNDVDAFRLTAVYPWQPVSWMKQLLVLSGEYREDFTNNYRQQLYNWAALDNKTVTTLSTADRVRYRAYLDDPRFYSAAFFDQFKIENLPRTAGFRAAPYASSAAGDGTEWRQASSVGLSASGTWLKGRVQTLLGSRWDWNRTLEYKGTRKDALGQDIPPPGKRDALPGEFVSNPALDLFNTSLTAGVTVTLTRDLNLYGVYSESFRFQDARTFDNKVFGPITGTTKEVGLKGDVFANRLGFSLGVFHIDRANVEYRWTPSSFSAGNVEDLMNPNSIPSTDPRYLHSWNDVNQFRDVMSTETSKGFDLTAIARPLPGMQVRLTLGKVEVVTTPDFSSMRGFLEAAKKRNDPAEAGVIAEAEDMLVRSDYVGRPTGARGAPWSGSWVFDYGFSREATGLLRGVRAGLNGSWRGDYSLTFITNVVGDKLVSREYRGGATHVVGAYLIRDQKLWGQQVRLRLGAKNLIDFYNRTKRRTGTTTRSADGAEVYTFNYIAPPEFAATVSVRF